MRDSLIILIVGSYFLHGLDMSVMLCDKDSENTELSSSNQEEKEKSDTYHKYAFVPITVEDQGGIKAQSEEQLILLA